MNARRVLVAGVGNIFLGDDGFGVEVANRLARRPLPDFVRVLDVGIRGLHLAYELLAGVDRLILVDAAQRGEAPGTVSVLRVVAPDTPRAMTPMDAHDMSPDTVLALVHSLGGTLCDVLVVTCEPADLSPNIGLSDVVLAGVDPAVAAVERLLVEETDSEGTGAGQGRQHHVNAIGQGGRAGRCRCGGAPVTAGYQALPGNPRDVNGVAQWRR